MTELFNVTVKVTPASSSRPFVHTLKALPGPESKAKRKARSVMKKMFPSSALRVVRTMRARKAEKDLRKKEQKS